MAAERQVGGLWCHEVLAVLSEYVDGELPAVTITKVQAHLGGCDWCERFGGRFLEVLATMRRDLGPPEAVPEAVEARLLRSLGLVPEE